MTPGGAESGPPSAASPEIRIARLLDAIYGDAADRPVRDRFTSLIEEHRGESEERARPVSWLIAYPDHVRGAGSPLHELGVFVDSHLPAEIEGIHILPCFPSSSDEGFSVMDYHRVDPDYGTWEDIEALASRRHLMLDAIVNHASARGRWFSAWRAGDPEFAGFFRVEDPDADLGVVVRARQHPLLTRFDTAEGVQWVWTTFSADQVDLDYRNPRVALAAADIVLTYAAHGASAVRLDAVGFLWKEAGTASIHLPQTHLLIQLLRAVLDATYPDVLLISETNVPHAENISYLGDGTAREADLVYQFPLPPLTLHAFTTGDASVLSAWLRSLEALPEHVRFFNFLASHDGVGLRPLEGLVPASGVEDLVSMCVANGGLVNYRSGPDGERIPYELNATWFDLVRGPSEGEDAMAKHLASHALLLALSGEPAIYLQALLAEPNASALAAETGAARSINRRRFTAAELGEMFADPTGRTRESVEGIGRMLEWRASTAAFGPLGTQRVLDTPRGLIGIERVGPEGSAARVFINVADHPIDIDTAGDSGRLVGFRAVATESGVALGPWGTAWLLPPEPAP